jgi:inhibitor of KinA
MSPFHPYTVFPLGDAGLIIDFGNVIDEPTNKKVLHLFHVLKNSLHPYITDVVPAYSSLAVYYNAIAVCQKRSNNKTAFETMAELIENISEKNHELPQQQARLIEVPVCYASKFSTDIEYIAQQNKIDVDEIIHLHTSKTYRVYMIGFLPGFAYMGQVDERIVIPRKPEPQNVVAGTVGIAGVQTGIYPLDSPGGWQIIGRTPLKLFDKDKEQSVLFQPGDEIKFYSITEDEFANYQAGRS